MSALTLPDVTGMTLTQAALAYAGAGWYVLPVAPGSKNPGSVVGKDWHKKSSRDPDQIAAWWAQNLGYGIALHVGRSGAVAFDLDAMTLVVIVDDADFAARSLNNFLWTTFTRSNPARDVHGIEAFTRDKHFDEFLLCHTYFSTPLNC